MWNQTEYTISQHFACALEYGDFSGFSDYEEKEFLDWMAAEQDGKKGHWSIEEISEDYGKCEVTGLFSNLMLISWIYTE